MKEYRIDFHDGPESNRSTSVDVMVENVDDAFRMAYKMPEARRYSCVGIYEKPKGRTIIGIEFEYEDTFFKQKFTGYTFIKANSESEAKEYYNNNIRGKHFWFDAGKPDPEGKNVYGRVKKTYFAFGDRVHFEA